MLYSLKVIIHAVQTLIDQKFLQYHLKLIDRDSLNGGWWRIENLTPERLDESRVMKSVLADNGAILSILTSLKEQNFRAVPRTLLYVTKAEKPYQQDFDSGA